LLIQNNVVSLQQISIENNKIIWIMGLFFNENRKHYCGKYKGIDVWGYGCMIGYNWYGEYYVTIPRGKSRRNIKVKDSVYNSIEGIKAYIEKNIEKLNNLKQ
jgi:hypothetical protein